MRAFQKGAVRRSTTLNQGLFNHLPDSSSGLSGAATWLDDVVGNEHQPVVLFGTSWCGYCWSARDVLKQLGVAFRDIDVQSPSAIGNNNPVEMRRALLSRTGSHTVPQIFIGGQSLGGATELVGALRNGQLAAMLAPLGIELNDIA